MHPRKLFTVPTLLLCFIFLFYYSGAFKFLAKLILLEGMLLAHVCRTFEINENTIDDPSKKPKKEKGLKRLLKFKKKKDGVEVCEDEEEEPELQFQFGETSSIAVFLLRCW